jgi:hypothetical protein
VTELIMMGVLVLTTCLTQAVGILVLVDRLDLIQTMLLKMQANELERLIAEQDRLIAGRTKELGDK